MINQLLEKFGVKYEDLKPAEKETLFAWEEALQKSQLSIEKIRDYISSMKSAVEQELTKSRLGSKDDMFLKARLRNYMLLEAFLTTPERAREQMENAIAGIAGKR